MFLTLASMGIAMASWPILRKGGPSLASLFENPSMGPRSISEVYVAKNGTPQQNVSKVVEMMGGIEKFIGKNDIVVLKPNAQWWNQGRTNLAAMKGFIDLVLNIPNFSGEVIIAENQHFMDDTLPEKEKDNIRGWTHLSEINGDIDGVNHNINTLIELYAKKGHKNVTKYHWRDGGPKKKDAWGNGMNGGVVKGPWEGDGYVWTDIVYHFSPIFGIKKWKVMMTYPVFTSSYSGITVDLKNGPFRRDGKGGGEYLRDRQVRLINLPVLNSHGDDTGITSSLKNYMGITDLSCGAPGLTPKGYHNVHACGGTIFQYAKAGPVGHFIKTIRKADLNITTAEWVGWGHRTDTSKATRMKTILAGTDPVSLDYYAAKYVVYPLSGARIHNPDDTGSLIRRYLDLAIDALGAEPLVRRSFEVHRYSFSPGGGDMTTGKIDYGA
ncbi:MAG: DUF362 domain-containing protein [Deltaproteobacteria bacterium]|nr:DUF362 domain-containing protein [Deltaproteobacteria bacterium]